MSQSQYGRDMGRLPPSSGSVKRARERAQAGLPREPLQMRRPQRVPEPMDSEFNGTPLRPMPPSGPGSPRRMRPPPPSRADPRAGGADRDMSQPMQLPQWPLVPRPLSPSSPSRPPAYRMPPGRPRNPPERPPRPSQAPPLAGERRYQEATPAYDAPRNMPPQFEGAVDENDFPTTTAPSARLTSSSMGTIPDFPAPAPTAAAPSSTPRRSAANLGPPPTSRRGGSSYYSNTSYVTPIPEESPRSRSHGSYASSAAMPEAWGPSSPTSTHGGDTFYDESVTDKSRDSMAEDLVDDESKLVRSASLGKRAKAALVTTKSSANTQAAARPSPSPLQSSDGSVSHIFDVSTGSSGTLPTMRPTPVTTPGVRANPAIGPDGMLAVPPMAAGVSDLPAPPRLSPSPRPSSRLSGFRRPPNLDIDAVRSMEARGSMTSLPDLIRRATRLAAMMDKGKRPASRFETLNDFLDEKSGSRLDDVDRPEERHRSGLSDMLASFPPPGSRGSWFRTTSWPLDPNRRQTHGNRRYQERYPGEDDAGVGSGNGKRRRRCCGLPIWAFLLLTLLVICGIVAAVVVPLEFFVFKNLGNHGSSSDVEGCAKTLPCLNGGTSVASGSGCSCICTNGFSGSDCSKKGSQACTTTTIASLDGSANMTDVTLGNAIPRLIEDAKTNFSVPLVGTVLVAKINEQNFSCLEQNALVTFDGRSTRLGQANDEVRVTTHAEKAARGYGASSTTSLALASPTSGSPETAAPTATGSPNAGPTTTFTVTEKVLDFARVAMLFLLQEESLDSVETAQSNLQTFFTTASENGGTAMTANAASSVYMGRGNTINLVDFSLNIGEGPVGNTTA